MPNELVTFKGVESVKLVEMEETGNYRLEITQLSSEGRSKQSLSIEDETAEDIKDIGEYNFNGLVETDFPEEPAPLQRGGFL